MVELEEFAPPPLFTVKRSTDVLRLMVPLLVVAVRELPANPVDVISPAPLICFAEPELVSRVTPPFAFKAPTTLILLSLTRANVPAPAVTPETVTLLTDWATLMEEVLAAPPLLAVRASTDVLRLIAPLAVVTDRALPPNPVELIKPEPVTVFAAPELVLNVIPPLALIGPVTTILLSLVRLNAPLPSFTDATLMERPV
jgi:hypothetical protein